MTAALTPPLTVEARMLEGWLDGDVPCEEPTCDAAAIWLGTPPCKHSRSTCAEHRREVDQVRRSQRFRCDDCGHVFRAPEVEWRRL